MGIVKGGRNILFLKKNSLSICIKYFQIFIREMYAKPLSKKERRIRDQRFQEDGYEKVYLLIKTE